MSAATSDVSPNGHSPDLSPGLHSSDTPSCPPSALSSRAASPPLKSPHPAPPALAAAAASASRPASAARSAPSPIGRRAAAAAPTPITREEIKAASAEMYRNGQAKSAATAAHAAAAAASSASAKAKSHKRTPPPAPPLPEGQSSNLALDYLRLARAARANPAGIARQLAVIRAKQAAPPGTPQLHLGKNLHESRVEMIWMEQPK